MKAKEREEVRRLRKEEGMSIKKIANKVGVSKASVSIWVRDIELTDEQKLNLKPSVVAMSISNRETFKKIREKYQEEGKIKAKENNALHIMGCMLYWAEGNKQKNSARLSNTDSNIIKLYVKFLRECFNVKNEDFVISIQCYTDKGITIEQIEKYWLELLSLERQNLRKTLANYDKRGKDSIRKKHLYGTCTVAVHSTEIVQSIFGAIQEYGGFNNPEWLDAVYGSYKNK